MRTLRAVFSIWMICTIVVLVSLRSCAADIDVRSVAFRSQDRVLAAQRFIAPGTGRRPAVVILHGVQGIDAFPAFYRRYAEAVARSGIDAYLLSYYDQSDALQAKSALAEDRRAFALRRLRSWSSTVGDVVGAIIAETHSSGRVGLLGFSQGGFLATAAAAEDERISALVVFYGGIAGLLQSEITRLPPLLELHGDADRVVPLAEGRALVDLARGFGQESEMIVYPGAGHGFDGDDALDAQRRTTEFFAQGLLNAPRR